MNAGHHDEVRCGVVDAAGQEKQDRRRDVRARWVTPPEAHDGEVDAAAEEQDVCAGVVVFPSAVR